MSMSAIRRIRCRLSVIRRTRFRSVIWRTIRGSLRRVPDVLVYVSEPLTEDVTIAGPVKPKLKIASTGTDSDFVVKLIDVYPYDFPLPTGTDAGNKRIVGAAPVVMGGYQQLVRGEPMRAKFRDSWEKPTALTPGKVTAVNGEMPDVNHTFRAGAPDYGAGAELVVPAGGSESADVCGYSAG